MIGLNIILIITILLASLYAGFMVAYVVSVNPGLAQLEKKNYLITMQIINRVIINPLFMILFLGSVVSFVALIILTTGTAKTLAIVAAVIFIVLNHGVTFTQNIPRNDRLESFDIEQATETEIEEMYTYYRKPWNFWHNIRTLTSTLSVIPLLLIFIL